MSQSTSTFPSRFERESSLHDQFHWCISSFGEGSLPFFFPLHLTQPKHFLSITCHSNLCKNLSLFEHLAVNKIHINSHVIHFLPSDSVSLECNFPSSELYSLHSKVDAPTTISCQIYSLSKAVGFQPH